MKGTIEERIVKRAQQKQNVQSTVYSGGAFKADIFKPQDVMQLLFDEEELDVQETNKFMIRGAVGGGAKKKKKKEVQPKPAKPQKAGGRRGGRKTEGLKDSDTPQDVQDKSMQEEPTPEENNGDNDEMEIEVNFDKIEEEDNDPATTCGVLFVAKL